MTDAANNVTTYAYDTENNLTSTTDASSRTTYFEYDAFGRWPAFSATTPPKLHLI